MGTQVGNFKVMSVSDGDTITVDRAPFPSLSERSSLRLVNIDTEETHSPKGFGPVTEYGKQVTKLTIEWFKERGNEVSLETDGDSKLCDYFGRALVNVFAKGDHYQRHSIEMGWTPYFSKYGYSEDHHQSLFEAQEKARKDKAGIWSDALMQRPEKKGRPYEMLLQWWNLRAEQVEKARKIKKEAPNSILLLINGLDYKNVYLKAKKGAQGMVFGEIDRAPGGVQAGTGLFVIKVALDMPFYVYIDKKVEDRNKIIEKIQTEFMSNESKMPESYIKPNMVFLKGNLSLFYRGGRPIPEMVISKADQISKDPIV